ncbi:unnamed protein product [Closterium sp. NIES-65]|nr:unnamed protein product [Closterium sp. NIES-65]
MEARNEALKRGMVALQRDVEAQSSALKQGVTVLHRDVEANMLSFQRGAEFWRRVVHLYGSYKLCQLQVAVSGQSEEEKSATWQRQHERGAEMLYALCTDMKGFFLKAGQFLAKPDLSPPAWVRRLSALHDAAPADPLPLVLQTIQEELGGMGWREVWEWVEEKPLGSASIAQVHRGRLRGGKEVAIKEQHTGAEPLMLTDLANLKAFAAFLQSMEIKAQSTQAQSLSCSQTSPTKASPALSPTLLVTRTHFHFQVQHAGAEPLMLTDLANLKAFAAFLQSTELNLDITGALTELRAQRGEPLMLTDLANLKAFAAFLQSTELNMDVMGALNELEKQSTELNMDVMGALNELEKQVGVVGGSIRAEYGAQYDRNSSSASSPFPSDHSYLQIRYEFDFRREAAAMDTIRASLAAAAAAATSSPPAVSGAASPVVVPASVPGLVTKRLLVMDLIKGSPIVKMGEEMRAKGVNPNGFLATRAKRAGYPAAASDGSDRIKGSPLASMEEEMRAKGAKRSQPASVPGLRLLIMDRIKGSPIVKMEEEMRAKGVNPSSYLATQAKSDGSDQGLSACDGMEEHMRAKGVDPNSFLATRAKGVRETSCSPLYCFGDALVQGRLELSAMR